MRKFIIKQIENLFDVKILSQEDYSQLLNTTKDDEENKHHMGTEKSAMYSLTCMMARNALITRELVEAIGKNDTDNNVIFRLEGLNRNAINYSVGLAELLSIPEDFEDVGYVDQAKKKLKQLLEPMSIKEAEEKIKQLEN